MTREPRVLVLGSSNHGRRVDAFEWSDIPFGVNVADYDHLILNLSNFGVDELGTPKLYVLPALRDFARLMFSAGSAICAIGSPDAEVTWHLRRDSSESGSLTSARGSLSPLPQPTSKKTERADWWLPVSLAIRRQEGRVILGVDDDWAFWFKEMRSYSWHFQDLGNPSSDRLINAGVSETGLAPYQSYPLATTRSGEPIALSLGFGHEFSEEAARGARCSCPIVWLPKTTELSSHEEVDLLLAKVFEVAVETQAPGWLSSYELPDQRAAKLALEERLNQLAEAQNTVVDARNALADESRWAPLLYERGKEILEPLVREALRYLGADVADPKIAGIEDGRFIEPTGRAAMIEVKGTGDNLGLADVRQLYGWMTDAELTEDWHGKGVVFLNAQLKLPVEQRQAIDLVAPNALKSAKNVEISIVPTTQLYRAISDHQSGTFDADQFWNTIFTTKGVTSLPEPTGNSDNPIG